MPNTNLIVILGPTASGKTALAVKLAKKLDGEIISADSRQVYRGLDIGSGKDLDEYQDIAYHLIDIVDPGYEYSVFDYQRDFYNSFEEITEKAKLPILAGGSALYVDSVLKGYRMVEAKENPELRKRLAELTHDQLIEQLLQLKPQQHNTTDLKDTQRLIRAIEIAEAERQHPQSLPEPPQINAQIIAINWPREITRKRITERLKERFEQQAMIEEVKQLHEMGVSWETLEFYGLEYRLIAQHLQKQLNYNDMFQKLNSAIHQFAKKQDTWLRRLQRQGHKIHWVDGQANCYEQALKIII